MFITLEGGEGAGKTTQIERIFQYLSQKSHSCVKTREPGHGFIGRQIRALLMLPENETLVPTAELLLFMADRAQHIESFILPEMKKGNVVLCDRFFDSTIVYQGFAGRIGVERVIAFHDVVFSHFRPDLTILFDLSPEIGLARTMCQLGQGERCESESRFEKKMLDFHERIREGFLGLSKLESKRIKVVNAEVSQEEVWSQIKKILDEFLANNPVQ
ncbi:dTMP kinase [Candidatus Campbellbacteria bacterium RIFCSPLOWO2_02_FULL_35_11]|uniref:Thymidylate kinase n=1 Tax=Candidatus Campbellbacteria bacterium RIFCSPLOWO2_02_FULL_35_11 TaxID=1797581 RepID=A0A1F5ETY2_9BACT|nr:MAG: dTMP kinase [Candidatus Campbellbacteria bacterium RIFCSPLOWO2_02_FULL_35_11]